MASEVKRAASGLISLSGQVTGESVSPEETVRVKARRTKFFVALSYAFCCIVWGTTWYAVRVAIAPSPGYGPYFGAALRFLAGVSLFILVWLSFARKIKAPTGRELTWLSLAGLFNGSYQLCVLSAEIHISGGLTAVLASTTPLMMALIATVTRTEKVSSRTILGFLACFFGVVLVCHDRMQISVAEAGATALMLLGAFLNACTNVTLKRTSVGVNPIVSATILLTVTALPIWAWSLFKGEPQSLGSMPPNTIAAIAYLAIVSSFAAFGLYLYMIKHMRLMTLSTLSFVLPILALVVDLFFEKSFVITPETSIGIFIVMAGVIFSVLRR